MVAIAPDECSPETVPATSFIEACTKRDLRISPNPFVGMMGLSCAGAISPLRCDAPHPPTNQHRKNCAGAVHISFVNCSCSRECGRYLLWVGSPLIVIYASFTRDSGQTRILLSESFPSCRPAPLCASCTGPATRCPVTCRAFLLPTIPASKTPRQAN